MDSSSPTRILLVDDHTLFRESLRTLLEEEADYRIVAEVATVTDAIELCRSGAGFDLALIDYDLGPSAGAANGVSVLRCLRERKEFVPALIIAARIDPTKGATINNHSSCNAQPPTKIAGPMLRAGLTEVLVMGMPTR